MAVLKKKNKKQQFLKRLPISFDKKYLGEEPKYCLDDELSQSDIADSLSWYNYFFTPEDGKEWLISYLRETNFPLYKIRAIEKEPFLPMTLCSLARMITMGAKLDEKTSLYFSTRTEEISEKNNIPLKEKRSFSNNSNKSSFFISFFEEKIDEFILNNYSTDFSPYDYFIKNEIKLSQLNGIKEFYSPLVDELRLMKGGKDDQLAESYANLTIKQKENFVNFLETILSDTLLYSTNKKKSVKRKPRKIKEKSADALTKKVNYKTENVKLKVKSIQPSAIVGAKELYIFNDKTRKLSFFCADDNKFLTIKGSTIIGFNDEKSLIKNVRKPEQTLNEILNNGKITAKRIFDKIKAKPSTPSGRINRDTLILRAIK